MHPRNIQLAFVQCCESLINDHPHVTLIFVESLHLISWMLRPTAQAVFSSCSVTTDTCLLICRRGCGAKSSPHACLMRWCGILREKSTLTSSEAFALEKYVPYDIFLCSVGIIRLCFYALLIYQLINMLKFWVLAQRWVICATSDLICFWIQGAEMYDLWCISISVAYKMVGFFFFGPSNPVWSLLSFSSIMKNAFILVVDCSLFKYY